MAGRIPPEFIEELLNRVDIVEVIESRMALKKTGKNYSGLCPFHNEKTPSFSVNPDKQFYYCFGCQASGDALRFVLEFDQLDFVPAVESLASRAGMEVPRSESGESTKERDRRRSIYDVLELACSFYKQSLREHADRKRAVSYLQQRGLSGEIARDFGIGYAPPGWDNLFKALATSNEQRQLLIDAGMLIENQDENKLYDRFRDRIMFPIRDIRGRVIGFGGRILGEGQPKYLNSPETPVFHKGLELYGLHEARKSDRRLKRMLVVEGYMDVVALAQHDVRNAVATLGTATSKDHVERIYRQIPEIVFCFDGDNAGRSAAWKALINCLPVMKDGRSARFLFLPDGEDPDTLIRSQGREVFEEMMKGSTHLPEFLFERLGADIDLSSLEGKATLAKVAVPLIEQVPEGVLKALLLNQLAVSTGLSADQLVQASERARRSEGKQYRESTHHSSPEYPDPNRYGHANPADVNGHGSGGRRNAGGGVQSAGQSVDLPDRVLTMLIHNPDLILDFPREIYDRLKTVHGSALLLEVADFLVDSEPLPSSLGLIGHFQNHHRFPELKHLAESEPLLGVAEQRLEFAGVVQKLLEDTETFTRDALKQELLSKPLSQLSAEQREQLRLLTTRQN